MSRATNTISEKCHQHRSNDCLLRDTVHGDRGQNEETWVKDIRVTKTVSG